MAQVTRNVGVTKSGYVHNSNPNTVYPTNRSSSYEIGWYNSGDGIMQFGLDTWPSSLKHNKLITSSLRIYARIPNANRSVYVRSCSGDFDPATLTYNNRPTDTSSFGMIDTTLGVSAGSWGEVSVPIYTTSSTTDADRAKSTRDIVAKKGFHVRDGGVVFAEPRCAVRTVLSNGSTAPYITVTYDDAQLVKSKVSYAGVLPSNYMTNVAHTLAWTLEKASSSEYCADETWVQASAKFYWRIAGTSTWNVINIAGSTTSVTIPAKTFPVGNSIEYYVEATDEDGTTTQTASRTITACASTITRVSYPDSSVDARVAQTFSWKFSSSGGEYAQKSAALYWKKSTDSAWNVINASGTTKSLTVPANTFPSSSTIQWYLKGTDEVDHESQSAIYTFTTLTSQVVADSYPSGEDKDVRIPITFTWHLSNSFTQDGATVFWKKNTDSAWHSRSVSGNTLSLTFPAYTFASGATIQWYISATDTLGVTTQTGTNEFETASAIITASGFPSGSNIDTRDPITFSWTITGDLGEYDQMSAKFYWKKSTASQWNVIEVNSGTKSLTVPGNTFPTGATVQWYLEGTDASGTVTSCAQKTFNTVATKITVQSYPSGNSVDFGSPLSFSWIFKSNNGNYGQTSASLFWRASTEDDWSEIQAEGSTQRLTVPAYTFPSNSTIQWYLEGTDVGGTVSSTSTMSFKTVSPQITPQNCPTSGYADPRNAITFAWYFSTGSSSYGQRSATFYWRVAGATAWNSVAASGTTQQVTIAANTFPRLSNIEWYLSGTDVGGTYSETEVFTFSTTASTAYAVCKDPVGRAEDGTKPITLKWIVKNEDGSVATRTIVRWKLPTESASQWHQLIDTTDNITEYTIAANFFSAGPVEWQVIAYNRDSVAGPASQASFVCIIAPDPPSGLTATNVPISEIHWQASGQEAYEISIDGTVVASGFGSDIYGYKVKEPLADGSHRISVRIQGSYGLWSNESVTQILVSNAPKGELELSGVFMTDADLYWGFSGTDEAETIAVYRDGIWIGTATGNTSFLDRLVLGDHEYRVEYWFSDGNYTRSNTVSGTMDVDTVKIAEASGGPWLTLRLSENSERTHSFRWSRTSAAQHITAYSFPILEISPYEDLTGTFECAFKDRIGAKEFERFFGKVVILKSREGSVIIGGLTEVNKTVTNFYITYAFSIQRIHWEDFVSYDAND